MNDYSVDKLLANSSRIVLPECTYCESRCWECIYLRKNEGQDMEGKFRCSYFGEWRYPDDGCGNGKDRWTDQKEKDEEAARRYEEERRRRIQEELYAETEREKRKNTRGNSPSDIHNVGGSYNTGGTTGNGGGGIILLIAGIAILFSMGLIKPTITFKLDSSSIPAEQYLEHTLNIVRMDDGSNSYPKNFKGYTAYNETLNEKGRSYIDLAKGGYDVWISHDGVSGFSGGVSVYNVFDKDISIDTTNLESGSVKVALLHLQGMFGRKITAKDLMVADSKGNPIPYTAYGEDGQYILIISDTQVDQGRIRVTVHAEGYEAKELELNFTESRIAEVKVKLTGE